MKLYRKAPVKPRPAQETHASIQAQTEAYLNRGGTIRVIPAGYTGQVQIAGPRQRLQHR